MQKILVIDAEQSTRNALHSLLTDEGYSTDSTATAAEGLDKVRNTAYQCVLCDIANIRLADTLLLTAMHRLRPGLPFIITSPPAALDNAIQVFKQGAFDLLLKPLDLNRLLHTIRQVTHVKAMPTQQGARKKAAVVAPDFMIGDSEAMCHMRETIRKIAPTQARILITGDNGVGKELAARSIHQQSTRAGLPMVTVNCAAIPADLIESELFGHERGSFTSAVKRRIGKFEQAHGGTLFLDEIGDMSLAAQAKVLRAIQEGKIARVGGETEVPVNVRIIAATNKDLHKEVQTNGFRLDLYHRLNVVPLHVPSLAERRNDIPLLVKYFLERISASYQQPPKTMAVNALQRLQRHKWTGNIRELHNAVERLIVLSDQHITLQDVERHVLTRPH